MMVGPTLRPCFGNLGAVLALLVSAWSPGVVQGARLRRGFPVRASGVEVSGFSVKISTTTHMAQRIVAVSCVHTMHTTGCMCAVYLTAMCVW